MSTSTVYASASQQAWSSYTQTSTRSSQDIAGLQPHYSAFLTTAKAFDSVADTFKATPATPSDENLITAQNACDTMSTALSALNAVVESFPAQDAKTINKAATLDQAALRKTYAASQALDGDLVLNLNDVLQACQMLYGETKYASEMQNASTG